MLRLLKRQFAAIGFFVLLACLTLYWLLFHATTHVPGDWMTDYFHFHWNFWWIRHALTTPGLNVYDSDFVLFPFHANMAWHTLAAFWYPPWAVVEPFFGTLIAVDVIFIVALALAGYCLFLLLRREGVSSGLALVGGAAFQLTPSLYAAVWMTTLNYLSFFWIPLQLVLWGMVTRNVSHRWRGLFWAVVQGLAFYGMVMTDLSLVMFCAFLLLPYGIFTLIRAGTWPNHVRLAALGMVAVALALLLLWFVGPLSYLPKLDRSQLAPPRLKTHTVFRFPTAIFRGICISAT